MPNIGDFAIVIGVDEYLSLPALQGPINDANQFHYWLLDAQGGDVPVRNCYLIPNTRNPARPLQDDIDDALAAIVTQDITFRRFYFFFAGHGMGVTWDLNGLCLPKWSQIQRNYALSSKGYLNYLVESSLFPEIYFFMDCCRSREINVVPSNTRLNAIRPRGGDVASIVIYATPFENTAGEAPVGGADNSLVRGFFSRSLVEGLGGAAADSNNTVTAKNLIDYCRRRTEELARANNRVQIIQTVINDGGRPLEELVICGVQSKPGVAATVSFATAGDFRLLGPDLSPIAAWTVTAGAEEGPIPLLPGLYCIENTQTNVKQLFLIDGNANTFRFSAN
ncbi:caspase family protein [Mucilaginibacter sp. cycad4]|uniref:caspase family protein n=1 Tax=Mucilaginibacter sp. cycad4 TaxID=3342096 RepID=UPI002AAA814E|nr:caspase family protein [Mucilaginibacter gossypii]WPV01951.1 caspase family protein [Mucilaginibacter gossypii]